MLPRIDKVLPGFPAIALLVVNVAVSPVGGAGARGSRMSYGIGIGLMVAVSPSYASPHRLTLVCPKSVEHESEHVPAATSNISSTDRDRQTVV